MKRRRSPLGCLSLLLFLAVLCAAGIYGYRRYMPTSERADLAGLYGSGEEGQVALFLNYEKQEETGLYAGGQTYVPVDWVNKNLNERFYWDSQEELLVYALPEEIVTAEETTLGAGGKPILLRHGDTVYLSLGLVLNYTDIRLGVYDSGPWKRVYVENQWDPVSVASVKADGKIRLRGGVKSPIITEVYEGEAVTVLETLDHWSRVMTQDGHIGYMFNRKLSELHEETPESSFVAPEYSHISMDEKIVMVWHQVTTEAANGAMEELMSTTSGVNVIAPTWFTLSDNQGRYTSLASKSYVDRAHAMGLQVWAVLDNFNGNARENVQTEELLSRTSVRQRLIDNLMKEADACGFDGINLDFEGLKEAAGPHYVQFIRELSVSCRRKGLVLSVDNYVPAAYNRFYNRREQGIVADYVIIMGYDEHYAGGEPGSVASLPYVKNGIEDTLELVPRERVINGVPFYTRLWTERDGETSASSMGIAAAKKWIAENNVEMIWDDSLGQYYGELVSSGETMRLWMEEEKSLGLKMDVIREKDLAGVAGWKLGLETADIWKVIGWK